MIESILIFLIFMVINKKKTFEVISLSHLTIREIFGSAQNGIDFKDLLISLTTFYVLILNITMDLSTSTYIILGFAYLFIIMGQITNLGLGSLNGSKYLQVILMSLLLQLFLIQKMNEIHAGVYLACTVILIWAFSRENRLGGTLGLKGARDGVNNFQYQLVSYCVGYWIISSVHIMGLEKLYVYAFSILGCLIYLISPYLNNKVELKMKFLITLMMGLASFGIINV